MDRVLQKKLIDKLSEMVRCSEAMNCILQEQQSALKTDDPDNLLRAINDMDECRCRLLDLDKALSDLKAKDKLSRQAIKIPEAKQLLDRANSLQEKNTDLMLSNRKLIDAKMEAVPEEIKELFSAVEESAWEQEETA
jgi:ribosomal protein L20A (L18A)